MSRADSTSLPDTLREWVEQVTGDRVKTSRSHHEGASRLAWSVDLEGSSAVQSLFLLQDKSQGGGSGRDAAVLRALAETEVPVPQVIATDSDHGTILLSRLPGRADYPATDEPAADQERVAKHLMSLTAKLHSIEPSRLKIDHLTLPTKPEDCARGTLAQARGAANALGDAADPFCLFALKWLDANVPTLAERYALVHSDMGPGNFLYENDRVTGIVDWEVAHFGDPMEDLAAIAIRDMATPVGLLAHRFDEYEASSGTEVDLSRVHYYRALVLVRNSLMIGLGLANPSESFDVEEMTMYQTLLVRAAALVICDNLGTGRPAPPYSDGDSRSAEIEDTARLLGHDSSSLSGQGSTNAVLREAIAADPEMKPERTTEFAHFFARRMHRLAASRKELLGPLFERLPQPLGPR